MKKTLGVSAAILAVAMALMIFFIHYLKTVTDGMESAAGRRQAESAQESPTEPAAEHSPYIFEDNSTIAEVIPESDGDTRYYNGDLELPVDGATGYAGTWLDVTASSDDGAEAVTALRPGDGFLILREQGDWWEVSVGGITGWVRHALCLINLPDVIPSIRYNCYNTYESRFTASGTDIPGITGEALYFGKAYNERLGKEEYIAGAMYAMSKRIWRAQLNAMREGDGLVLYEAFRPYSVQRQVAQAMSALLASDSTLNQKINSGGWSLTWFISTGISNHQRGGAMDVGLLELSDIDYAVTGGYTYLQTGSPDYYAMPTPIHELSVDAVTYTRPVDNKSPTAWQRATMSPGMEASPAARALQKYCTDAGLTPLASEWWHFNDLDTLNDVGNGVAGDFILTECYSVPPGQTGQITSEEGQHDES